MPPLRTCYFKPPRPQALVEHKDIQREHIERVYLPRSEHLWLSAACAGGQQSDGDNDVLPAGARLRELREHRLLAERSRDERQGRLRDTEAVVCAEAALTPDLDAEPDVAGG